MTTYTPTKRESTSMLIALALVGFGLLVACMPGLPLLAVAIAGAAVATGAVGAVWVARHTW